MSNGALETSANVPVYGTLNTNDPKSVDPLKETVGDFGKWQAQVSLFMALLKIPIAWFTLSIVFLAPPSKFWCKQPTNFNQSESVWINVSRPSDPAALKHEGLNVGYCIMKDFEKPNMSLPCIYGYSYDKTVFRSTIISEWDLVCGHQRLIDLTQITLMLGVLLGNLIFGVLADKKGRKPVLVTCIILQSIFGVLASLSPWYIGFIVCRFFLAISNGGTMVTSFVMCMEIVGGRWRTIIPILYQMPFGVGNSIMAGLAFFLRDWRMLHLTLSLLASLFTYYILCIPESPRWLLAVGKKDDAIKILRRAAKINGKDESKVEYAFEHLSNFKCNVDKPTAGISVLFGTRELKKRTCLLILNWTICGVVFYSFSQYLGNIGGDIFLTIAANGLIVLPGTVLCIVFIMNCGRRWTIAIAHVLMATCFVCILLTPKGVYRNDWPRVGLAGMGIVGFSVAMPALYLFTGELYPTLLRNAGVGVAVMFSRLGSMLAPMLIVLEEKGRYLPLTVLTLAALLEVTLILPLPETKGVDLPETVEDLDRKEGYKKVEK